MQRLPWRQSGYARFRSIDCFGSVTENVPYPTIPEIDPLWESQTLLSSIRGLASMEEADIREAEFLGISESLRILKSERM